MRCLALQGYRRYSMDIGVIRHQRRTPEGDSMPTMLRCRLPMALLGFALVCLLPLAASGALRRIEILSHEPWLDGQPLGKAGAYEKVRGRAYFAVDPSHLANQRIADLTLAPHNAQAQVEFWGDFVVLRPRDPSKARS